jgi:hypothetical protein
VRPQQTSGPIATMWRRSRLRLVQLFGWVWRQGRRGHAFLGRSATERARVEGDCRQVEARARFWAELREGQREAEALSARRDP